MSLCKIEIVPYFLYSETKIRDRLKNDVFESICQVMLDIVVDIVAKPSVFYIDVLNTYQEKRIEEHFLDFRFQINEYRENEHQVYAYSKEYIENADFVFFFSNNIVRLEELLECSKKIYIFLPNNKKLLFRSVREFLQKKFPIGKLSNDRNLFDVYDYKIT